jgi:hypothetical protein
MGGDNTASGYEALYLNSTGVDQTAVGALALMHNTTGRFNTSVGTNAMVINTTGSNNVALGYSAGKYLTTGINNIDIGNYGVARESRTIRIGTQSTQTRTFIAGISGTTVSGAEVIVNSSGQLGVATSSARYKRDIRDMGSASAGLMRLRPVSFRYRNDPTKTLQYGLVAEEVARVYPELVTRGPDGNVQTVRYLEFTALLLNELQKLDERVQTKDQQIAAQQRQIEALRRQDARINTLSERLTALEQQVRIATPQGLRPLASK